MKKEENANKTAVKKTRNRKASGTKRKKITKSTNILAIALAFIVVALLGYLVIKKPPTEKPPEITGDFVAIEFYFTNTETNKWETEIHNIPKGEQTEMIRKALEEWLAGPKSETLAKSIPSYISIEKFIEEVKFDDVTDTVVITYSEDYDKMSDVESSVCNVSLVYTLTSFDFISNVHFYIGEAELLKPNGQPVGILNRENIVLDKPPTDEVELKTVTLYFADEQAMGLVPEERELKVNPNLLLEKYIVEELIKGPTVSGHYAVLSQDIKLRPIKTEEGLCYVDFSADFIKKFEGGSAAERLMIYAIVNSLTELPHIKKVQILAEGDKIGEDKGFQMDLSKPIERYEEILIK